MGFIVVQGGAFHASIWMLFFYCRLLLQEVRLHTVECGSVKSDPLLSSRATIRRNWNQAKPNWTKCI